MNKLIYLVALNENESISRILSYLISPIGQSKHPYNWTDNELLGAVEKYIKEVEDGNDE